MSKGIKIPVGVNRQGGLAYVEREDNNWKLISTSLSDCDSANAFQQDLGIGSDIIFDVSAPSVPVRIAKRVRDVFKVFEGQHKFKLLENTMKFTQKEGELSLSLQYVDLESDETYPFVKNYGPRGQ